MFHADVKRETLGELERGVIVGLVIGEGSFTGDGRKAQLAITMHVRQEQLLRWLTATVPGSRLYGPYEHSGRRFFRWMLRGRALAETLQWLEPAIDALCPYVAGRIALLREQYGSQLQIR